MSATAETLFYDLETGEMKTKAEMEGEKMDEIGEDEEEYDDEEEGDDDEGT